MNDADPGFAPPEDLLLADFGEEGTLAFRLSHRAGKILNPTARMVFDMLREGGGIGDASEFLAREFGIDPHRAREDVTTLAADLAGEGLLGRGSPPAGTPPLPEKWMQVLEETMEETKGEDRPEETPVPEIPEDAVPARTEADVILREEEEGAFLFEPESGELSCLNPVGIDVWKLVDGEKNLGAIVDAVAAEYADVERDTVLSDVRCFLGDLKEFGYVSW